jgi:hypothetical protein
MLIVILQFQDDEDRTPEVIGPFDDEAKRGAWVEEVRHQMPWTWFIMTKTSDPWEPQR